MNAAEDALDKYKNKNTIKDSDGNVIKSFDSRVYEALKDYRNSADRDWALKTIQEYNEVLDGFEYGLNEKMDSYLADRDKLLDMYTAATQSTLDAWSAIISRTTNQGAVDALKSFADTYSDTSKITGAALEELAQQTFEEYGWKILSDAGKALSLPIIIGSHTMRKSFANIAACVDKSSIDMNAITKIQGLLNLL